MTIEIKESSKLYKVAKIGGMRKYGQEYENMDSCTFIRKVIRGTIALIVAGTFVTVIALLAVITVAAMLFSLYTIPVYGIGNTLAIPYVAGFVFVGWMVTIIFGSGLLLAKLFDKIQSTTYNYFSRKREETPPSPVRQLYDSFKGKFCVKVKFTGAK